MSDVIYNISSGFFDSVNGDRLYSAADMNKPYKRVIADGIFPTPQGTPSTDFQVVAVSGMSVAVLAGNAMIGSRWAENADDVGITIAGNSSSSPRIDSIFLHIDTGMDTRAAGVVYRQGTAAGTPTAPAMVQTDNITELRLADILVAPSAAIITQANITDQRGGSDCPWVAGLIQQVDTSALFEQYRAAYAEQQQDQADEWNTFMNHLARDYDISMSLRKHESTYTSTAAASLIPINIDGYDTTKDLLQVYINGIFAVEGTHYIVKSAAQIQLTNAISAGQNVHFVIYKAVMGGAQPIIPTDEQVQDAVDAYMDAHPGALVVDPELSDTSTHAIQNKAVTEALAGVNGRLQQYEDIFTGDVDESVQNWLDEHPEATTSVQDGSLTLLKFKDGELPFVTPEQFGAKGNGADDSQAIIDTINYAKTNGIPIALINDYRVVSASIVVDRDMEIIGAGGSLISNGTNTLVFSAVHHSLSLNTAFEKNTNTVSLISASNCAVGDIVSFESVEVAEISYNTKYHFSARIVSVSNNVITLNDTCPFSFDTTATVVVYKDKKISFNDIKLNCQTQTNYSAITIEGLTVYGDNIDISGKSDNYAFVLSNCVDFSISNVFCKNVLYGFVVNGCNNGKFETLFGYGAVRHIVTLNKFSKDIVVDHITGNGALIESHVSVNPTYKNANFMITNESWNLRSLGGTIDNCTIKIDDNISQQSILLQSISLNDTTLWENTKLAINKCNIDIDGAFEIRNGYAIEITDNTFARPTTLYCGASTTSKIRDIKASNNVNLSIAPSTRQSVVGTTILGENVINADDVTGGACSLDFRKALSYRVTDYVSHFKTTGCVVAHQNLSATTISIPITIYYDPHAIANSGYQEILSNLKFKIQSQYLQTVEVVELTSEIVANPYNNYVFMTNASKNYIGNTSTEVLDATITDLTADGNSVSNIPQNHCIRFNLNITNRASSGCRLFVTYESDNHCISETY